MPLDARPSESAESFVKHIHNLRANIRRKITMSNKHYKFVADMHHRILEFNERHYVMVFVHPKHYLEHSFKKLHAQATGPFHIIHKLGRNAYFAFTYEY